ncbi:MAG: hypothetical protein AUI16_04930 [Alphaproteobacteria bacterium 13_2_20CM_2_64_7]|nr:MAG: hypothetical protein AUI16_04930 [Alphaproteobacteria bacterium 13_2_20CM_2_64_7]
MDQARLVDLIFQAHPESLAHLGPDPEGAVGLPDAEHRGRLAVDLDAATLDPQHRRRGAARARLRARKRGGARSRDRGEERTA